MDIKNLIFRFRRARPQEHEIRERAAIYQISNEIHNLRKLALQCAEERKTVDRQSFSYQLHEYEKALKAKISYDMSTGDKDEVVKNVLNDRVAEERTLLFLMAFGTLDLSDEAIQDFYEKYNIGMMG